MLKELYTAAMGMMPQQTKLEVVSNNIANASTVGYKRDGVFERNIIDSKANLYNITGNAEQQDPPVGSYIDQSQGSFTNTENKLDLAIDGKGYFLLRDEQGKEFLSRAGNFKLDEEGNIISANGKHVQADGGSVNIAQMLDAEGFNSDPRNADLKIEASGEIFVNGVSLGTLDIVDVGNEVVMEKISSSDFIVTGEHQFFNVNEDEVNIRQGWLEESNVNVIDEMVQMIKLQRLFDAGSKVINTNEATLDESIRMGRYY